MIDWIGVIEGIRLNVRVAAWCGIGIVTLETSLERSLRSNSVDHGRSRVEWAFETNGISGERDIWMWMFDAVFSGLQRWKLNNPPSSLVPPFPGRQSRDWHA